MLSLNSNALREFTDGQATGFANLSCIKIGKQKPRLLRHVVIPSTPAQKTSEFFDSINNLDPVKFTPPESHYSNTYTMVSNTHTSYSSITKLNPFFGERYTRVGDFFDPQEQEMATDIRSRGSPRTKHRAMPHSQSENNIASRSDTGATDQQFNHIFLGNDLGHTRLSDETYVSSSQSRGRSISRTPSPSKHLEDIKEDQSPDAPRTPIKRSRSPMKQMFGERGWLGKSTSMNELPSEEYRKTGLKHWGGKIKQRMEHLTEDVSKFIPNTHHHESPSKSSSKSHSRTRFHVSLSPPLQAKLYSEMELMICATANQYLNIQQQEGRMTVESVAKVTEFWISKNRPQVIEFMFDQATQRDLVLYNLKTFRFYGPNAGNILSMNSMMQSWKTLAREMSVRTFCAPDSVIRKHTHDCHRILEMLGAPLVTFLAFQELQVKALKIMMEEQKKRDEYGSIKFGVEKKWEPAVIASSNDEEETDNPFIY